MGTTYCICLARHPSSGCARGVVGQQIVARCQRIQRGGKASVDRRLHQHFDDFSLGDAQAQGRPNMDPEMRSGAAQDGQR